MNRAGKRFLKWPMRERLPVSVERGRPFGVEPWMLETATKLGLEASLRPRGRPKKEAESAPSLFDRELLA